MLPSVMRVERVFLDLCIVDGIKYSTFLLMGLPHDRFVRQPHYTSIFLNIQRFLPVKSI